MSDSQCYASLAGAEFWLDSVRERRGLMAIDSIRSGDIMMSVPWHMCLSSEHLENRTDHPLSAIARSKDNRLSSADLLALLIIYEYHNPRTELAPYLCKYIHKCTYIRWLLILEYAGMLPRKLMSTIYWDDSMLESLGRESPLYEKTLKTKVGPDLQSCPRQS